MVEKRWITMTVGQLTRQGERILKSAGIDTPALDAGVIMCYVLKCSRIYIYTHPGSKTGKSDERVYMDLIDRRSRGEPLQYITGSTEFMSLPFMVNCDVLIPRPETEVLVETAIEYSKKFKGGKINILDMGTGSGCIAVSLAKYIDNCKVTAVDISKKVLKTAYLNAVSNKVENRVKIKKSNLFSNLNSSEKNDIIVSNPPYIPSHEIKTLQKEIKNYEPEIALDGGTDGLDCYKDLIEQSPEFLNEEGVLILEAGIGQARKICKIMQNRFRNTSIVKDLSGIDRVVAGIVGRSFLKAV